MDGEIVHFPGYVMQFGSVCRQRCLWCGALIQEQDLDNIGILEENRSQDRQGKPIKASEVGWWSGLVGVSGANPVILRAVDDPVDGKAPNNSCMILLPEDL